MTMPPIRVNRAPVLTLWASIVAERLGHPPATALSLASAVAGTAARAKAKRLGLAEERASQTDHQVRQRVVRLLGRDIPVTEADGVLLAAEPDDRPARPEAVGAYLARAFGDRLGEVRAAMEALAGGIEPEELDRTGFRLYEGFRPEVPDGVQGWGAKAELELGRIHDAARR